MAEPNRTHPHKLKWINDHAWQHTTLLDQDFDLLPNQYEPTAENLHKHRVIQPAS